MEKRKTDLVVGGYLFDDERKLLLIHHKKLNCWLPVGGHIEPNETPDEAILREFREEVGLSVELVTKSDVALGGTTKENLALPFYVNVHSVGDHDHCCFFYICRINNHEGMNVNKGELNDSRWVGEGELEDPSIPSDVRNIARKAFSLLK